MKQNSIFSDFLTFPGKQVLNDVLLRVKVTPKAARERIGDIAQDSNGDTVLKIYVNVPALENKANEAVLELLAKYFKLPKTYFLIVKGATSRNKIIKITAVKITDLQKLIM